jgi:hypothetical protein
VTEIGFAHPTTFFHSAAPVDIRACASQQPRLSQTEIGWREPVWFSYLFLSDRCDESDEIAHDVNALHAWVMIAPTGTMALSFVQYACAGARVHRLPHAIANPPRT